MTSATQVLLARAAPSENAQARATRLPGVDGIRALAVCAVVLYHLDGDWLPGGYLGVDVFFVVSGYLITRLLVAERCGAGRVSLRHFWIRRARRILPPLFPMLLVTVVGTALLDRSLLHNLRADVVGALTYTSNWVQITQNGSYFAKFDAPSPLKHLWSLAVEEQFYLVWPLVALAALLWSGRRGLAVVAGLGAIGSAIAMGALYQPGVDPSHIYYSTLTHSAGLLVGAVLAIAWPATKAPDTPRKEQVNAVLSVVGVVGIGVGFWWLDEYGSAPYRGGIFAVSLASALLIVGAGHGQTAIGRLLSHPAVRWLGARSYGLYLWHWPVLVLGGLMFGPTGPVEMVLMVAASVILAAASYRLIERPVQLHGYGGAFSIFKQSVRDAEGGRRRAALLGAGALAAACVFAALSLLKAPPPPSNELENQLASAQLALQRASAGPGPTPTAAARQIASNPVACTRPLPPGNQITALGDSVMLAASQSLLTTLPGIQVDAETNRSMHAASSILAGQILKGTLRPVVLLGLGTNGVFPRDMLEGIIDQIGPTRTVYLVNVYLTTKQYTPEVNQTLAAVARARPNVHVADWQVTAGSHADLLYADGIHPRPGPGADLYANMVVSKMSEQTQCPTPKLQKRTVQHPPRPSAGASGNRAAPAPASEDVGRPQAMLASIAFFRVPTSIVVALLLAAFLWMRTNDAFETHPRSPLRLG